MDLKCSINLRGQWVATVEAHKLPGLSELSQQEVFSVQNGRPVLQYLFLFKLPPVYVAQQPSAMAAAAAMMMYAPAGNQQQWQWPPQQPQQQLIYPSGVPQYAQQSLTAMQVPMHDPVGGAGMNGNGGVACAYLGHDNQEMLRG